MWKCLWPQLASRPETALPVAFVGETRHQGSVLSVSPGAPLLGCSRSWGPTPCLPSLWWNQGWVPSLLWIGLPVCSRTALFTFATFSSPRGASMPSIPRGRGRCAVKMDESHLRLLEAQTQPQGWSTHRQASVAVSVVVQWLSPVRLFVTPWSAARRASLSFSASQSLLRLMFIESMMPSNRLILSQPLLLPLPSIFPSIRVFSNEMALLIRWSKYRNFSTSPSNEYI